MTDEQFDEICRSSLHCELGTASAEMWSRVRPPRRNWLPSIPEILSCGFACGIVLLVISVRVNRNQSFTSESNPIVQKAMGGSLSGLQASAVLQPDSSPWSEESLSFPSAPGASMKVSHLYGRVNQ